MTTMRAEDVARVTHEANRAYCLIFGDSSQLPWDEAPEWQRESVINGVRFHLEHPNSTPEDSHRSWLEEKQADGWVWGPVKVPDAKKHPCMLPYGELPEAQRRKDSLFCAIVLALTHKKVP